MMQQKSTRKHRFITNIMEWLQSFAVYVSVIARKQPQPVPGLAMNIRMTAGWHMTDVFCPRRHLSTTT